MSPQAPPQAPLHWRRSNEHCYEEDGVLEHQWSEVLEPSTEALGLLIPHLRLPEVGMVIHANKRLPTGTLPRDLDCTRVPVRSSIASTGLDSRRSALPCKCATSVESFVTFMSKAESVVAKKDKAALKSCARDADAGTTHSG